MGIGTFYAVWWPFATRSTMELQFHRAPGSFFFFSRRYNFNSLNVFAVSAYNFQSFRSWIQLVQFFIFSFFMSFLMPSSHLFFGLPSGLLAPGSKLNKMYHCRCTAKNSRWWAERLPEICRVVIPIKLEFSPSLGFIHKELVTTHGHTILKYQS
jgi:hypothetical protein